jgi:hypothetical protein
MDDKKLTPKKLITLPALTVGLGVTGTGVWGMLDIETLKSFLTLAWREELIKMLIAFFLAGIIHRFLFRRDIEKQLMKIVNPIVDALNNIADKSRETESAMNDVRNEVVQHGKRISLIEQHLTPRVE